MPADHQAAPRAGKQQQGSRSRSSTSETSKGSELARAPTAASAAAPRTRRSPSPATLHAGRVLHRAAHRGQPARAQHRQSWQQQRQLAVSAVAVTADCIGIAHPAKAAARRWCRRTPVSDSARALLGMVPAQPFNFGTSAQMTHFSSLVQDGLSAGLAACRRLQPRLRSTPVTWVPTGAPSVQFRRTSPATTTTSNSSSSRTWTTVRALLPVRAGRRHRPAPRVGEPSGGPR
ncbi:hypothetical protein ZWY2020_051095 [Hordeum vulgare]|nr:hypothetical protein ZWY2020_051095 [Hordeum vulgare]